MKKNNRKGFTLVELIVVSTIMVMIMGAILNFIQPINNFYTRTQYNSDANDVGNTVMSYIEDEIRYASNVTVLEDYEGVPSTTAAGFLANRAGANSSPVSYTNVIIIDNTSLRGSQLPGYDANGTVAHRKGATGCVLSAPVVDGVGLDMTRVKIMGGEPLYGDMRCVFTGRLNTSDEKNKCLTIGMELYRPEWADGGTRYKFDKMIFNQTRDLELVNINLKNAMMRNMRADYFSNSNTSAASIDYYKYAPASPMGGVTPAVSDMYTSGNRYTYIFYTKEVTSPSDTCRVTLYSQRDGGVEIDHQDVYLGRNLTSAVISRFEAAGRAREGITVSGMAVTRKTFVSIESDGHGSLADYDVTPVTQNMDFYCVYTESTTTVTPRGEVFFRDKFDDMLNEIGYDDSNDATIVHRAPVYDHGDDPINDNKIPFNDPGRGDPFLDFLGWNKSPDGSGSWFDWKNDVITSPTTYYAVYGSPATLNFEDETGASVATIEVRHSMAGSQVMTLPQFMSTAGALIPSSGYVLYWDVYDSTDTLIGELSGVADFTSGDVFTVKARLVEIPPPPASDSGRVIYYANVSGSNVQSGYKLHLEAHNIYVKIEAQLLDGSVVTLYNDFRGNGHIDLSSLAGQDFILICSAAPNTYPCSLTAEILQSEWGTVQAIIMNNVPVDASRNGQVNLVNNS